MRIGKRVGKYTLDALLGEGGMGKVFRASDPSGRKVAIKFLLHGGMRRFDREAELLQSLNHPCIVQYMGEGELDGLSYIMMEHLKGESLAARIVKGPIEPREAMRITRRMCEGLEYAHGRKIVHRDLKPSNIFLVEAVEGREEVKVLDFGIAKMMTSGDALTETGASLGTLAYMPSGQINDAKNASRRDDLWAVGAILYEMLTQSVAYKEGKWTGPGLMVALAEREHLPKQSTIGDAEWDIVAKALAPRRDDRFQSAHEMIVAIDAYLQGNIVARTVAMDEPPPVVPLYGVPQAVAIPPRIHRQNARRAELSRKRRRWGGVLVMLILCGLIGRVVYWYGLLIEDWWAHIWTSSPTTEPSDQTNPLDSSEESTTPLNPSIEGAGQSESECVHQERTDDRMVQRALDDYGAEGGNGGRCIYPACEWRAIRQHIIRYWHCTAPERKVKLCWLSCRTEDDDFSSTGRGRVPNQCREVLESDRPCLVRTAAPQPVVP